MRRIADVAVGQRLEPLSLRISRSDLIRYACVAGDRNPLHWSDRLAREAGLPGVIAHGMLVMAMAGRAVCAWAGDPRAFVSYDLRFTRPLVVPDDAAGAVLEVDGSVTAVQDDKLVRLHLIVRDGDRAVVGRATAVVRLG